MDLTPAGRYGGGAVLVSRDAQHPANEEKRTVLSRTSNRLAKKIPQSALANRMSSKRDCHYAAHHHHLFVRGHRARRRGGTGARANIGRGQDRQRHYAGDVPCLSAKTRRLLEGNGLCGKRPEATGAGKNLDAE